MSNVQFLRAFVNQRLTLAAEEIFGLFERTIAEYEEKLQRSEENQQKLLDSFYNPKVLLQRAEVQEPEVQQEEVPHEQRERSSGLNQQNQTEVSIIKIEEVDLWSQPQALMEESIFLPAAVKIEGEEKLQSSQLHENPAEEDRDALQPQESDSDDSACDGEIRDSQSGSEESGSDTGSDSSASSSEEAADQERHLLYHCGQDKGPEPVDCSLCKNIAEHRRTSSSEQRPFKCSICNQTFNQMSALTRHARVHTSETSLSCAFCGLKFSLQRTLDQHMAIHTGENPHSCSVCGLTFALHGELKRHMLVHQGEKPFSCSVCGNKFTLKGSLKRHMATHLDEKPFRCHICGNTFTQSGSLKRHMIAHKDENPYSCSMCDKSFAESNSLRMHMAVHRQ